MVQRELHRIRGAVHFRVSFKAIAKQWVWLR
jgi:hypothetical protein